MQASKNPSQTTTYTYIRDSAQKKRKLGLKCVFSEGNAQVVTVCTQWDMFSLSLSGEKVNISKSNPRKKTWLHTDRAFLYYCYRYKRNLFDACRPITDVMCVLKRDYVTDVMRRRSVMKTFEAAISPRRDLIERLWRRKKKHDSFLLLFFLSLARGLARGGFYCLRD